MPMYRILIVEEFFTILNVSEKCFPATMVINSHLNNIQGSYCQSSDSLNKHIHKTSYNYPIPNMALVKLTVLASQSTVGRKFAETQMKTIQISSFPKLLNCFSKKYIYASKHFKLCFITHNIEWNFKALSIGRVLFCTQLRVLRHQLCTASCEVHCTSQLFFFSVYFYNSQSSSLRSSSSALLGGGAPPAPW